MFGGIDLGLFGISVTSNDPRLTLLYTSLLLTVYILSGGHLSVPASLVLPARAAMSLAVRALSGSWNTSRRVLVPLARIDPAVIAAVRTRVAGAGADRYLAPEIEAVVELARDGSLVAAAESVTGALA